MQRIEIRLEGLINLYGGALDDVFLLAATKTLQAQAAIIYERNDLDRVFLSLDSQAQLADYLAEHANPDRRHTVLLLTDQDFVHFEPEVLAHSRLGVVGSFSAMDAPSEVSWVLDAVLRTDFGRVQSKENRLLSLLDQAAYIRFTSRCGDTPCVATFEHRLAKHWFALSGPLHIGDQSVLPTGEVSALSSASGRYDHDCCLQLNGRMLLRGAPIVHRGEGDASLADTEYLFRELSRMGSDAAIATIRRGYIVGIESAVHGSDRFARALEGLIGNEPRYARIHEIGFGLNEFCMPLAAGNTITNERCPFVHLGLGLGGVTPYHCDLVCSHVIAEAIAPNGDRTFLPVGPRAYY